MTDLSGFGAESGRLPISEETEGLEQRIKPRQPSRNAPKVVETIRRSTGNDEETLWSKGDNAFINKGGYVGRTVRKSRNSLTTDLYAIIVTIVKPKRSLNALEYPQRGRQRQWQQGK